MTDEIEKLLVRCEIIAKDSKDYRMYEYYKRKIDEYNLPPDEYEAAIRRITETIGV